MPTYIYACDHCGEVIETKQHYNDEPIKVCPACSKPIRRIITGGVGVIYKGGGWFCKEKRLMDIPPEEI